MNKIIPFLLALCMVFAAHAYAEEDKLSLPGTEVMVRAHDGNELPVYQYPARGEYLVLWIGGSGWHDRTTRLAMDFAHAGIEVWQIDFAEALLQTSGSNFLRNLDARYVADVIDAAHLRTGKKVILFTQAYGAIPLLRGATLWQQRDKLNGKLLGAIIFSPDLVTGLPALGKDPEYLDITRKTNIPMIILQGGLRSSAAQFLRMLHELWSNNHHVYYSVLPGIAGMFYRDEPNAETLAKLKALPGEMPRYFRLLEATPWQISKGNYVQPREAAKVSLDIKLRAFQGNPQPLPIQLKDISGRTLKLEDYRGKVTVVNFWATWCPPCVEEIPSLNRLREEMQGEEFELISINFAETPKTVNEFMKRVNVEFPVLIDPSGKVSQQWNVIGFPSTFVIGKDGKIKYGVNAAIHWDAPEVIEALKALGK